MPAKSKKQYRFMQAVAHGMKPRGTDLSQEQAEEFVEGQESSDYKDLPEKKKSKKIKKVFGGTEGPAKPKPAFRQRKPGTSKKPTFAEALQAGKAITLPSGEPATEITPGGMHGRSKFASETIHDRVLDLLNKIKNAPENDLETREIIIQKTKSLIKKLELLNKLNNEDQGIEKKKEKDIDKIYEIEMDGKTGNSKDCPCPTKKSKYVVKKSGEPEVCGDCESNPCQCFSHLSKPMIKSFGSGKKEIIFGNDWNSLDQENFLNTMKYVIQRKKGMIVKSDHLNHFFSLLDEIHRSLKIYNVCQEYLKKDELGDGGVISMNGATANRGQVQMNHSQKMKKELEERSVMAPDKEDRDFAKKLVRLIERVESQIKGNHLERMGKTDPTGMGTPAAPQTPMGGDPLMQSENPKVKKIKKKKTIPSKVEAIANTRSGFHKPTMSEMPAKGKGKKYGKKDRREGKKAAQNKGE